MGKKPRLTKEDHWRLGGKLCQIRNLLFDEIDAINRLPKASRAYKSFHQVIDSVEKAKCSLDGEASSSVGFSTRMYYRGGIPKEYQESQTPDERMD